MFGSVNVTILYTAHIKAAVGTAGQKLTVKENATLADCFEALCEQAPPQVRELITDNQRKLRSAILLCVDDEQKSLDDPEPLSEGAEITVLAAISGG